MKSLLLTASEDARLGFRLAGIDSKIVKTGAELLEALELAINDENIALILITTDIAEEVYEEIMAIKLKQKNDFILLIPKPKAPFKDYISEYVSQSIGIKS